MPCFVFLGVQKSRAVLRTVVVLTELGATPTPVLREWPPTLMLSLVSHTYVKMALFLLYVPASW